MASGCAYKYGSAQPASASELATSGRIGMLALPRQTAVLVYLVPRRSAGTDRRPLCCVPTGTLRSKEQAAMTARRGYYRIPRKFPSNRVDGLLAEVVRAKFRAGWPKARIARELRLARRTVIRICAASGQYSNSPPP